MRAIVGGKDVSFGYRKQGNADFLYENADRYGYEVRLIDKITIDLCGDGSDVRDISSTLLKEKLASGDIASAEKILGHKI